MTNFANKYATRLAAYLENDATSCTVESVTGDPAVPYNAIIGRKGAFPDEIVTVTNVTGSVLTITRATEAVAGVQTAYDHPVGATFTAILTAGAIGDAIAAGVAISALPAVVTPATTDLFVVSQGGTSMKATLLQVAGFDAGTTFPTGPATGRRYFRTDLGMEFYFNGTLWLSTELHHEFVNRSTSGGLASSSTDRAVPPCGVGVSMYLEKVVYRTTLAATSDVNNYWSLQLNLITAAGATTAAVGGAVDTKLDAASASAINTHTITVNTVIAAADAGRFELTLAKSGSPSNLIYVSGFSYRWTAT